MPDDELSVRRVQARRVTALRATRISVRWRWSPHWQFEARVIGAWGIIALVVLMALAIAMILFVAVYQIVLWSIAGDWRLLTAAIGLWALVLWRVVIVMTRRPGSGGEVVGVPRNNEKNDDR